MDDASGTKHGALLSSGKIMETVEKMNFIPIVNMTMGMRLKSSNLLAVLIAALIALLLSPMLAALLTAMLPALLA